MTHQHPEPTAAVAAVFSNTGPLAQTLEGFEPRAAQLAMAEAVAGVFDAGGTLLAEAGTGTGKTLAYLVPAILHRRRTLVSTGTKNLQDQIVQKDLPLLQRAMGVPFKATCMKGRGNYLCLHRFEQVRASVALRSRDEQMYLALIEAWASGTATGDRGEIEDLPDDLPLWSDLSTTTDTCLGSECPRYGDCFVTLMRQRAAESDLVIVNHHLLCADAAVRHHSFGEVIPECSYAVIDEAHQLEDVATQYFGVLVSNHRLQELVRDGERALRGSGLGAGDRALSLGRALSRLDDRAVAFFGDLQRERPGAGVRGHAQGTVLEDRRRITSDTLDMVAESGLALISALDVLEAEIGLIPEPTEDLRAIGRRTVEVRDALRFLMLASDPSFVYFLEIRGRGVFLRAAPIDVSAILGEVLFDRMEATVLTSATLAVNGEFDYVRDRLGLTDARELQLPSEFDYARQAILYLPRRMPDPRSREFSSHAAREIAEILVRTEGRAFALFTSYATLREVQAYLTTAVPYPLFVQGTAPRSILLEQFRQTPNAVLLATSSFWQGVDVVGEALSCVIIDKLPFASPGDPIVQARLEAIAERGGDPFNDYQVPLAILTLLQGLGRLLRHRTDRGVLAILDPRLRTKAYGRRFLGSLPPAPLTHDLEDIARFFEDGSQPPVPSDQG